jgi:hypothetical protein
MQALLIEPSTTTFWNQSGQIPSPHNLNIVRKIAEMARIG